ncbi:hypothetical protein [Jatrophihabitans sp.]
MPAARGTAVGIAPRLAAGGWAGRPTVRTLLALAVSEAAADRTAART